MNNENICLVIGVGPGTGYETAKIFSENNYKVVVVSRTKERVDKICSELKNCFGFICDVYDLDKLIKTCETIKKEIGNPSVFVHNAVAGILEGGGGKTFLEGDPTRLEYNFRINTTSFLYLARSLVPDMIKKGRGSIVVTGNTAAKRGKEKFAYFAPTKAAQRILAESMARTLGPKGIHVSYFIIDAAINTARTRPVFFPEKSDDFFCEPKDIAAEIYRVAHQPRSAWSFEVELRPFRENW